MARAPNSIKQHSTAIRVARRLRERVLDAAEGAQTVALIQSVWSTSSGTSDDVTQPSPSESIDDRADESTRERNIVEDRVAEDDDEQSRAETATEEPSNTPEPVEPEAATSTTDGAVSDAPGTPSGLETRSSQRSGTSSAAVQGATVYRLYHRCRRVATTSWLYRWLTKEPEPDVIVIDLRTTWTAGPVLARLEEGIRDLMPATLGSAVIRAGYQLRNRTRARPIRVVSIATIAFVCVAFVATAVGGGPIGAELFILFGLLILAIRGTQSRRTWSDIAETRWYQWLQTAFEPPDPPERGRESGSTERVTEERTPESAGANTATTATPVTSSADTNDDDS